MPSEAVLTVPRHLCPSLPRAAQRAPCALLITPSACAPLPCAMRTYLTETTV